jgi:hypothetical protein
MLVLGALFALLVTGVWLYCLVDILVTPAAGCRYLPKPAWLAIVVLTFGIGAAAWMCIGRPLSMPQRRPWRPPGYSHGYPPDATVARTRHPAGRARATGPDDDPEFLSQLDHMIRGGYDTGNEA